MSKILELSEQTYQQLVELAQQQHRTPAEMLGVCLATYEAARYERVHRQMVAEGLLRALPTRPLAPDVEAFEPEAIPGPPLSETLREERREGRRRGTRGRGGWRRAWRPRVQSGKHTGHARGTDSRPPHTEERPMQTATLFHHDHSQAVQLPQEFHLPGTAVYIKQVGNALVLLPMDQPWEPLLTSLSLFSADFMQERHQPPLEPRGEAFA